MFLTELSGCLSELYTPEGFKDYIASGLLIEGKKKVARGLTAVSFNVETARKAVDQQADFLVVHHGHGFWDNQPRLLVGGFREKVSLLLQHQISLFAYHLPMDAQPEWGNNIQLLRALGLKKTGEFLPHGSHWIGLIGDYPEELPVQEFVKKVEKTVGQVNFSFLNGVSGIQRVAICTGGAAGSIREAHKAGADIFLTGEAKEETLSYCQDENFNFLAAGHYNTETFGPKALARYLSDIRGVPTQFVDVFNPV